MPHDRYYESEPARWLSTWTLALTGLQPVTDPALPDGLDGRLERPSGIIRVAPGLRLGEYHDVLAEAAIKELFNISLRESRRRRAHLRVIDPSAALVPPQRAIPACEHRCDCHGRIGYQAT